MPVFDAMAPVTNGNTAAPAAPQLAIQPTPPEMRSWGRMRAAWFVMIGNMGPRKNPMKETATASPMSDGTSHTTSSRLRAKSSQRKAGMCAGVARTDPRTVRMYTKMARRSPIYKVRALVNNRVECDSRMSRTSLLTGKRATLPIIMPEIR